MKVINQTMRQLVTAALTPYENVIVQNNTQYDYILISPVNVANALFEVFIGRETSVKCRAGSIISLRGKLDERNQDISICAHLSNLDSGAAPGTGVFVNDNRIINGLNEYSNAISVEILLLTRNEASTYMVGKLRENDIVFRSVHFGGIAAGAEVELVNSHWFLSTMDVPLSARIRMSGGYRTDDTKPVWLINSTSYNGYLDPTAVPNYGHGIDEYPLPGIGEAYLQIPLIGWRPGISDARPYSNELFLYNGMAGACPAAGAVGRAYVDVEIVAGHLPPMTKYFANYRTNEAAANAYHSFHMRSYNSFTADRYGFTVYNASAVGIWRTAEYTQWSPYNPLGLAQTGPASNHDTNAGVSGNHQMTEVFSSIRTLSGFFTAVPTTPDVSFQIGVINS